jgi:hypothetical protein
MKYWLCASLLTACLSAAGQHAAAPEDAPAKRANELMLAGLRPGKDTQATAESRYKPKYRRFVPGAKDRLQWADECTGRALSIDLGTKNIIQSITVSALGRISTDEKVSCHEAARDVLQVKLWKTGRGLKLGDPRDRVIELYGEPNSDGPSTKGNHELELLFYAFHWAGSDVPQVMEVSCDRATGRVLEITLAAPSL